MANFEWKSFGDAVLYMMEVHKEDKRVTGVPAAAHLLAVAATVMENGGSQNETIAALLHDSAEDFGGEARLEDIRLHFGAEVETVVRGCSDSLGERKELRAPWGERKRLYVRGLADKGDSVWRVVVADKLHNSRAMFREAREGGGAFWTKLNRTPEETIGYFQAVHDVLRIVHPGHVTYELGMVVAQLAASFCDPVRLRDSSNSFADAWE